MTRRKKPPPQSRLQHITDASGWTHVIKGPPGIVDPRTTDIHLEHGKATETKYTLDTYLDRFRNHYTPTWRESYCFKGLTRIFEQDIFPAENILITQCICLGLGSMTAGSESPSYELAALIQMLEILGTNAQEPKQKPCSIPYDPGPLPKPPAGADSKLIQQPARQNPPNPRNNLPRPHLHPSRPNHPKNPRLHRRRNALRLFQTQRNNLPLRTPSGMSPLRHRFGSRNARIIRGL